MIKWVKTCLFNFMKSIKYLTQEGFSRGKNNRKTNKQAKLGLKMQKNTKNAWQNLLRKVWMMLKIHLNKLMKLFQVIGNGFTNKTSMGALELVSNLENRTNNLS